MSGALGARARGRHCRGGWIGSRRLASNHLIPRNSFSLFPLDILPEKVHHSGRGSTGMATDDRIDLLQGTLDMLILRTLLLKPAHGHTIVRSIEQTSEDVLQVDHGSLYPALHRLQR